MNKYPCYKVLYSGESGEVKTIVLFDQPKCGTTIWSNVDSNPVGEYFTQWGEPLFKPFDWSEFTLDMSTKGSNNPVDGQPVDVTVDVTVKPHVPVNHVTVDFDVVPELTYKRGDKFKVSGSTYMLSSVSHEEMALIDIDDGNRYVDSVPVHHPLKVTLQEMNRLANDKPYTKIDGKPDKSTKKERTYKTGDQFELTTLSGIYKLMLIGYRHSDNVNTAGLVILVDPNHLTKHLNEGLMWYDMVEVGSDQCITQQEFDLMHTGNFKIKAV